MDPGVGDEPVAEPWFICRPARVPWVEERDVIDGRHCIDDIWWEVCAGEEVEAGDWSRPVAVEGGGGRVVFQGYMDGRDLEGTLQMRRKERLNDGR